MFLNVIKGAYPSLIQIDKALPSGEATLGTIERGSCLYVSSGTWKVTTATADGTGCGAATTPGAFVFFALQADTDLTGRMAGTPPSGDQHGHSGGYGAAVINALACSPTIEIETDMYTGTPALGSYVMAVAAGKLGALTNHGTAVGMVTAAEDTRWCNNAVAVTGFRTGAPIKVLRVLTMYVPNMVIA